MTQEYGTYLFKMHTYFFVREAIPDGEPVMRLLDVLPISVTLGID